ncbi:branched-chain amino acid ABC transporter permease [Chloroflexota bacterium]
MTIFMQLLLAGIMIGIVYGVIAVGFVIVYKASGIFNLAQGELVAIGAFIAWQLLNPFGLHPVLVIFLVLAAAFAIGWLLSIFPFKPVLGQSMFTLFTVSLALMIFLRGLVISIWSANEIRYFRPLQDDLPFFSPAPLRFGELAIYRQDILGFGLATILLLAFWAFFKYSRTGLAFRAVSENSHIAQSLGISLSKITALALAIGAMVAALGGVILGLKYGITVYVADLGLAALAAVLIGGLESITGAIIGGLIIGIVFSMSTYYIGHSIGDVAAFIVMIAVLFVRPHGLFGQKRIERV